MAGIKMNKKVSVKTVFGTVNAAVIAKHPKTVDGSLAVMRVIGMASGVKSGTTNFGDYTALTGVFKATNLDTGAIMGGSTCFLPDVALDMVAGLLAMGKAVEFGFDIHADLNENSPVGFSYSAIPLASGEHDPLAALEAKLNPPVLAAPETPAEEPAKKSAKK